MQKTTASGTTMMNGTANTSGVSEHQEIAEDPAMLLVDLLAAAKRAQNASAEIPDGSATAYGEVVRRQFLELARLFAASEGENLQDAKAYCEALEILARGLRSQAGSDPASSSYAEIYRFIHGIARALTRCVDRLIRENGASRGSPSEGMH
jgi:hypothetical protein